MKNIDRWVIGASMSFCAARKPAGIFIRLSRDSVADKSLPIWLSNQLKASKVQPDRICFQVTEQVATQYMLLASFTDLTLTAPVKPTATLSVLNPAGRRNAASSATSARRAGASPTRRARTWAACR